MVDETFQQQTADNADRFAQIEPTAALFLPGGAPPELGSVFRNRGLARTYRLMTDRGVDVFYRGRIAREIVRTMRTPPTVADAALPVPPGVMTARTCASASHPSAARHASPTAATRSSACPRSSGGSMVGEALNILERFELPEMTRAQAMHHDLEASALAFADRNRCVGDPGYVDVPIRQLLSGRFAAERVPHLARLDHHHDGRAGPRAAFRARDLPLCEAA